MILFTFIDFSWLLSMGPIWLEKTKHNGSEWNKLYMLRVGALILAVINIFVKIWLICKLRTLHTVMKNAA